MFDSCFNIRLGDRIEQHKGPDCFKFTKDLYERFKLMGYERMFKGEEFYMVAKALKRNKEFNHLEDAFDMCFVSAVNNIIYKIGLTSMEMNPQKLEQIRNHVIGIIDSAITQSPEIHETENAKFFIFDFPNVNIILELGQFKTGIYLTWGGIDSLNPKVRNLFDRLSDAFA